MSGLAPRRPFAMTPALIRDPNFRNAMSRALHSRTVKRLLTLAYQREWAIQQNLDNPDAPPVRPEDAPLTAKPLQEHPLRSQGWWRAEDRTSLNRIDHDIIEWVVRRTDNDPRLWDSLTDKMNAHCSRLPDNLPGPISREAQQETWRKFDYTNKPKGEELRIKRKLTWYFFHKNLQLYATLALAEKDVRTTAEEESPVVTVYQKLAKQMESDSELTLLCERVATSTALLSECERFYSYLDDPEIAEPGHTAQVRRMRGEQRRKLQRDEARAAAEERARVQANNEAGGLTQALPLGPVLGPGL